MHQFSMKQHIQCINSPYETTYTMHQFSLWNNIYNASILPLKQHIQCINSPYETTCIMHQFSLWNNIYNASILPMKSKLLTINDEFACIKSHIVCKFEWSHWVSSPKFHGRVNVLWSCLTPLYHTYCLHHIWHQQTVHNETWCVLQVMITI